MRREYARLAASNLTVSLSGRNVVDAAELALNPGEVVGLLGPNGAGKSTLMRAIAGHVASTGHMHLGDQDLRTLGARERARLIAYLPQARVVAWSMRVADLVGLGRMPWRGFASGVSEHDRAACRRAMDLMDITELGQRVATELSGGEQARVLTARAIAQETPLLLADEPASGLDPAHQITMMQGLRRLVAEDRAILVSLHDLTLAARWCDRIVMMKEGRIAAEGAPDMVLTEACLRGVFGVSAHIGRDAGGMILAPTGLAGPEMRP